MDSKWPVIGFAGKWREWNTNNIRNLTINAVCAWETENICLCTPREYPNQTVISHCKTKVKQCLALPTCSGRATWSRNPQVSCVHFNLCWEDRAFVSKCSVVRAQGLAFYKYRSDNFKLVSC